MTHLDRSTFLRRVLLADGIISGTTGLAMFLGAAALGDLLGLPISLLRSAGISLLPYAAFLFFLARRDTVSRLSVWSVIALNVAWAAASILLLFGDSISPNRLGSAFVLMQAGAVVVLAEMQWVGLRRVA
jgi:hypothetical protein